MDRLLKFADQHAAESSTSREFDEKFFQQFIEVHQSTHC